MRLIKLFSVLFINFVYSNVNATSVSTTSKNNSVPHIIMMLVDDWGWANFGIHRKTDPLWEVQTPNLDSLANQGIILDRHYGMYM